MTVLDASAVLALIHNEPGADLVEAALPGSLLGAVNLAEVVGTLVDIGADVGRVRQLLTATGVVIVPVTEEDAELPERCARSHMGGDCPWVTGVVLR